MAPITRALLIIGVISLMIVSPTLADDDFQYWSVYEISKELNPEFELFYSPQFRLRDDASELFYHEHRQGIRWKPSQYLHFSFNYLIARNEPAKGEPNYENRGELDITPRYRYGPWAFSLRGRIGLRQVQGNAFAEEWRYRLKPKIAYKTELFGHPFTPYVSNDLFYDDRRHSWNQNRVYLGVSAPVGAYKGIQSSVSVWYLFQSKRGSRGDWSSNHIVGTKLSFKV